MKRYGRLVIAMLLVFVLCISLGGCGKKKESTETEDVTVTTDDTAEKVEETEESVDEPEDNDQPDDSIEVVDEVVIELDENEASGGL